MNKFIILGDIHISPFNTQEVLSLLEELRIKDLPIIQLGDFFHTRNLKPEFIIPIINYFKTHSFKYKPIVLVGNHDIVNSELSMVELLEPYVRVINKIEFDNIGDKKFCYIPYMNKEIFIKEMRTKDISCDYLFSHLDIVDYRNKDFLIPMRYFEVVSEYIFNGHIHTPKDFGKLKNVGSIYPITFTERNDKKGYYILSDELEFVPIDILRIREIDSFEEEYNNKKHIIYFTGVEEEAIKYDNVKKLIIRNKRESTEFKEMDILEGDKLNRTIFNFYKDLLKEISLKEDFGFQFLSPEIQRFFGLENKDLLKLLTDKYEGINNEYKIFNSKIN